MATSTTHQPFPSRPYASGLNRGGASTSAPQNTFNPSTGFGGPARTSQEREAQRLERERLERAERERLQQAGQNQLGELSEEQREEINEAVGVHR